jgi:hypothetical protein
MIAQLNNFPHVARPIDEHNDFKTERTKKSADRFFRRRF